RESSQSAGCIPGEHASSHHVLDCADGGGGCGRCPIHGVRHERGRLEDLPTVRVRAAALSGSSRLVDFALLESSGHHCCLTLPQLQFSAGVSPDARQNEPWSHWITRAPPSNERRAPRRYRPHRCVSSPGSSAGTAGGTWEWCCWKASIPLAPFSFPTPP